MLCWRIGLDLDEHPFLSVDQPAFTAELLFVLGVIRLLLVRSMYGELLPLVSTAWETCQATADAQTPRH